MIKWKKYKDVLNFIIKKFPNSVDFYYSFKQLKEVQGVGETQVVYLKPIIIDCYKRVYNPESSIVQKTEFEKCLIYKLKNLIIPKESSFVHFILLVPPKSQKSFIVDEMSDGMSDEMNDENDQTKGDTYTWVNYVPDLKDFFKGCKSLKFVKTFNHYLSQVLSSNFKKCTLHYYYQEGQFFEVGPGKFEKMDCLDLIDVIEGDSIMNDAKSPLNLFITSLHYQLIRSLSCYKINPKQRLIFRFDSAGIISDKANDIRYGLPLYYSIDINEFISSFINHLQMSSKKQLEWPIENIIAIFCLTGLANCFNVMSLNAPGFLNDALESLENGKTLLNGTRDGELLDEDDKRFTFDYELMSSLLSKNSKTKKFKKIKHILKDYEKLLNFDLQL